MVVVGGTCIIGGYCRKQDSTWSQDILFKSRQALPIVIEVVVFLKPSMHSGNIYTPYTNHHRLHTTTTTHYPTWRITIDYVGGLLIPKLLTIS